MQKECKLQQTISFLQHDLEVKAKSNANALKAQNMFLKNLENQNSGKRLAFLKQRPATLIGTPVLPLLELMTERAIALKHMHLLDVSRESSPKFA